VKATSGKKKNAVIAHAGERFLRMAANIPAAMQKKSQ
jgi:hypothetical protein